MSPKSSQSIAWEVTSERVWVETVFCIRKDNGPLKQPDPLSWWFGLEIQKNPLEGEQKKKKKTCVKTENM